MIFYFLFPNPTTTHVDFELSAAQVSCLRAFLKNRLLLYVCVCVCGFVWGQKEYLDVRVFVR